MRAILAAAVLLAASSAQAEFYDGNKIYPLCEGNKSLIGTYIAGWLDKRGSDYNSFMTAESVLSDSAKRQAFNGVLHEIDANICIPPGQISLGQMVDVLCKHLTEHPETRHLGMSQQLVTSLSGAWPCRK
ncbi:Rap1a/Tai family immunity protein [Rhizobium leguminosarum]